jgi:hypothetical protein
VPIRERASQNGENMESDYEYVIVDEERLDALLSGQSVSGSTGWATSPKPPRPRPGSTGVVWLSVGSDDAIRPLALIINDDDIRRLCGRYAQLHGDLSPLTAWCRLLTPRFLDSLDSMTRTADLGGLEAAWTGLAVAEAVLLAERPIASLRISACLATHSFAIARANALWSHLTVDEITRRFDVANRLLKGDSLTQKGEDRASKIRASLQPLWETLIALSKGRRAYRSSEIEPIVSALQGLMTARAVKDPQEISYLVRALADYVPEAEELSQISDIAPEGRLRFFDKLVENLDQPEAAREKVRRNALALLAGYLATIAAGGSPSLKLVESLSLRLPEVTAWAYLLGGVGEKVLWTSSFDGLGRLVARELLRPLRFDEAPTCDFALDEALALVDTKLPDPLVHLKVKQARLLTVELLPGVNVSVPIGELNPQNVSRPETNRTTRVTEAPTRDLAGALADAIWPHIRSRIDDYFAGMQRHEDVTSNDEATQRNREKRKSGPQAELPLRNTKKR